jgi:hypothetical protein
MGIPVTFIFFCSQVVHDAYLLREYKILIESVIARCVLCSSNGIQKEAFVNEVRVLDIETGALKNVVYGTTVIKESFIDIIYCGTKSLANGIFSTHLQVCHVFSLFKISDRSATHPKK